MTELAFDVPVGGTGVVVARERDSPPAHHAVELPAMCADELVDRRAEPVGQRVHVRRGFEDLLDPDGTLATVIAVEIAVEVFAQRGADRRRKRRREAATEHGPAALDELIQLRARERVTGHCATVPWSPTTNNRKSGGAGVAKQGCVERVDSLACRRPTVEFVQPAGTFVVSVHVELKLGVADTTSVLHDELQNRSSNALAPAIGDDCHRVEVSEAG